MASEDRSYLGNIKIEGGMFSNKRLVKYKYENTDEVSGFFSAGTIQDGKLEVKVIG